MPPNEKLKRPKDLRKSQPNSTSKSTLKAPKKTNPNGRALPTTATNLKHSKDSKAKYLPTQR